MAYGPGPVALALRPHILILRNFGNSQDSTFFDLFLHIKYNYQ